MTHRHKVSRAATSFTFFARKGFSLALKAHQTK